MIPVLMITYNRLPYTKKALSALLATKHPIELTVWDNGSTDGTQEYLASEVCSKFKNMHLNTANVGINVPFNAFIRANKDAEFIAKVDNDTIVDPDWIDRLLYAMEHKKDLFACGSFMQRPPGQWTFQGWVDKVMRKEYLPDGSYVAHNSYTGGSGVLIRTKVFHEHGLLYEKYACNLGDWTLFQRAHWNERNIAWYSGTTVRLLNIKEDGVSLNEDFPEYEAELKKVRDEGNAWYTKMGAVQGLEKWIAENGGRERL